MKITKLATQERNVERVNMFLDGRFFCGVSLNTVAKFNLFVGKERLKLQNIILVVSIFKIVLAIVPCLVVASANVYSKSQLVIGFFPHKVSRLLQNRSIEGKKVDNFGFVLDEEIIETNTPSFYEHMLMFGYE